MRGSCAIGMLSSSASKASQQSDTAQKILPSSELGFRVLRADHYTRDQPALLFLQNTYDH